MKCFPIQSSVSIRAENSLTANKAFINPRLIQVLIINGEKYFYIYNFLEQRQVEVPVEDIVMLLALTDIYSNLFELFVIWCNANVTYFE